jgi:hypothetical protein
MTRRQEVLDLLPATLPELMVATGLSRGNLSRVLADALEAGAVYRIGVRRKYTYVPTPPPPPPRMVSSVFDLGACV